MEIIEFEITDNKKYREFMVIYDKDKERLCITPKNKKQELSLETYVNDARPIPYTVYYIRNNIDGELHIMAFALVLKMDFDIYDLTLLCNNIMNKGSSIQLLNYIYDTKIKNTKNILKIRPANPTLLRYYTTWKQPSIPLDMLDDTKGYLCYYWKFIDVTRQQLMDLLPGLNTEQKVLDYLNVAGVPPELKTLNEIKSFLHVKVDEKVKDRSHNEQLHRMIDNMLLMDDIIDKLFFQEMGGGKMKRKMKGKMKGKMKVKTKRTSGYSKKYTRRLI